MTVGRLNIVQQYSLKSSKAYVVKSARQWPADLSGHMCDSKSCPRMLIIGIASVHQCILCLFAGHIGDSYGGLEDLQLDNIATTAQTEAVTES